MLQGILLAAGKSTRFGSQKLLHRLAGGLPMIIQSADNMVQSVDNLIIVVNEGDKLLPQLLDDHGYESVVSPHSGLGIGYTIADAVSATYDAQAWMIGLGDMPYISPSTTQRIAEKYQHSKSICVPYFQNRRGHPVVFPHPYGEYLRQLTGDSGARSILDSASTDICRVVVDDEGILIDVDTPPVQ